MVDRGPRVVRCTYVYNNLTKYQNIYQVCRFYLIQLTVDWMKPVVFHRPEKKYQLV